MYKEFFEKFGDFPQRNKLKFISMNLFLLCSCIYVLTSSGNFDYMADVSTMRSEVVKSLWDHGELTVPSGTGIRGVDGKDFSWFGIGSALISLPLYALGKIAGFAKPDTLFYMVNPLISAATVVLIFRFCVSLGYSLGACISTSLVYGFTTIAWRFSKDPGDHAMETFFLLFSVYCLYLFVERRQTLILLLSGALLGIASIVRPTSILILPSLLLMLILVYRKQFQFRDVARYVSRDGFLLLLAFLPFAVLNLWYNQYRFGSLLESGYSVMAARSNVSYFSNTSFLVGLKGFLISPGKGLFYFSPIAILFFFSIKSLYKRNFPVAICFVSIIVTYICFFSKYLYWHGDNTWGPRYIFAITPYLIIPIAYIFSSVSNTINRAWRFVISVLLAFSLLIQLLSISVNPDKYFSFLAEHGIKFTSTKGDGIQPIILPSPDIYFSWQLSPIIAQASFFSEISKKMMDFQHSRSHTDPPSHNLTSDTSMHVFDFCFVYEYFIHQSSHGLFAALTLSLMIIFIALRLRKLLSTETQNVSHTDGELLWTKKSK